MTNAIAPVAVWYSGLAMGLAAMLGFILLARVSLATQSARVGDCRGAGGGDGRLSVSGASSLSARYQRCGTSREAGGKGNLATRL